MNDSSRFLTLSQLSHAACCQVDWCSLQPRMNHRHSHAYCLQLYTLLRQVPFTSHLQLLACHDMSSYLAMHINDDPAGCGTGAVQNPRTMRIPRATAPALAGSTRHDKGPIMGASAFAFQGTNAHVQLTRYSYLEAWQGPAQTSAMPWKGKRRIWLAPAPHQLAQSLTWKADTRVAVVSLQLNQAAAGFLWDHQVIMPIRCLMKLLVDLDMKRRYMSCRAAS